MQNYRSQFICFIDRQQSNIENWQNMSCTFCCFFCILIKNQHAIIKNVIECIKNNY